MKKGFRIPHSKIVGMDDYEFFWAIIEPIWPDNSVIDELEHISQGTPGQRAIYATTLFMREVDNGGLEQFFLNSSGLYSKEVLIGFQLLGMNEHAEIIKRSFNFFPNGEVPLDSEERQEYLNKKEKEIKAFFEPLSDQIYGEERLFPYFRKYIESHPEEFFVDNYS